VPAERYLPSCLYESRKPRQSSSRRPPFPICMRLPPCRRFRWPRTGTLRLPSLSTAEAAEAISRCATAPESRRSGSPSRTGVAELAERMPCRAWAAEPYWRNGRQPASIALGRRWRQDVLAQHDVVAHTCFPRSSGEDASPNSFGRPLLDEHLWTNTLWTIYRPCLTMRRSRTSLPIDRLSPRRRRIRKRQRSPNRANNRSRGSQCGRAAAQSHRPCAVIYEVELLARFEQRRRSRCCRRARHSGDLQRPLSVRTSSSTAIARSGCQQRRHKPTSLQRLLRKSFLQVRAGTRAEAAAGYSDWTADSRCR